MNFIKLYIKLFSKIYKIKYWMSTLKFKLLYYPFVKIGKKTVIETNVQLKIFFKSSPLLNLEIGEQSRIYNNVLIQGKGKLEIGNYSSIGQLSIIGVGEHIKIGNNVMIAQCVTIRESNHNFDNKEIPMRYQGANTKPIIIEDDVWIGHGAIILQGVTIKSGSIIAAGAVVTNDIDEFSIVGGIPARVIKSR